MKTFQSLYGYNENVSYLKEKQTLVVLVAQLT